MTGGATNQVPGAPGRRLAGKVAVVTGAGTTGQGWGNGKASAVLFAREGARVVLVDRSAHAVADTQRIVDDEGGEALTVVADAASVDGVAAYVAAATERFGRIDVLHNNIGIAVTGSLIDADEKSWDLVYRVNVRSTFLACRAVVPVMKQHGGGAIVNVSSIASMRWTGVPYAAYSSSKAALNQLTQAIAIEHARDNIRCNAVVVGYVDTPLVSSGRDEATRAAMAARRAAAVPLGRSGDAWDVAYASLFLACEESRFVTGTQLVVDGGMTAVADR